MTLLQASKFALMVGLLLAGSIASSAFAQTTLRVAGSVADEFGAPLVKAQVSLYSPDRILGTTSDAAGHFQFDRTPAGVYELQVVSPSFKTKTIDKVTVNGFSRSEDLQFKITMAMGDLNANCGRRDNVSYGPAIGHEGNSIIGTVAAGKSPIANARVSLLSDQGEKVGEEITNEKGYFYFKPSVPGRYLIEMRHPSFNLLRSTVFWTARENQTHLILDPVPVGQIIVCQ